MSVLSPCVRNCCLDKQDVCIGCGRTLAEIIRWSDVDDEKKKNILIISKKRKKERASKYNWGNKF